MLLKVSSWEWFSYIDLKSACHQLRLLEEEKHRSAFEANRDLWQFMRLRFRVEIGVPAFQKAFNTIDDGTIDDGTIDDGTMDDGISRKHLTLLI